MIPSRVRQKLQTAAKTGSNSSEVLCPICSGPLTDSDIINLKSTVSVSSTRHTAFAACCCQSCRSHILPKDLSSLEGFFSLLPISLTERVEEATSLGNHLLRSVTSSCFGLLLEVKFRGSNRLMWSTSLEVNQVGVCPYPLSIFVLRKQIEEFCLFGEDEDGGGM